MPRRRTEEVAEIITDRLINRGAEGSREWVRARVLRWGREVARLTENNPCYVPIAHTGADGDTCYVVGADEIPMRIYREWVDVQDGSRKVRGDATGHVVWED